MRKLLLSFLTLLLISGTSISQKTLLAGWTFDAITAAPNTPTSVPSEFGVFSSSALYADGTNGSSSWVAATTGNELTSFSGSTLNDPRVTTSTTQAYSLLNSTANGKAIVFKTSTLYYKKIRISFDTRGTSTGFTTQQYWYSTDGSTWTNFAGYTPSISGFVTKTFDLTAVTSLDNKANIYFKISFTGASAATGNNRIDNVQITSDDARAVVF